MNRIDLDRDREFFFFIFDKILFRIGNNVHKWNKFKNHNLNIQFIIFDNFAGFD